MTYEYLNNLKKSNISLKLLNSDNFALILSFLYLVFKEKRNLTISQNSIEDILDELLYDLNQSYENIYPKEPKEYLNDWTNSGFLKRYYNSSGDIIYEITPYSQSVLEFVESLEKREFVGSQTKFNIIFELLEELEFETNLSDEEQIKALEEQKEQINQKIKKIKRKEYLKFDSSRVKEQYFQIVEQSRKLLYDFAQIEYNFKELNKEVASKILNFNDSKGKLLSSIFDVEESIRSSDQGKSFFAFWQILTDSKKSERLSQMIDKLYENSAILEIDKSKSLKNLKYDLLNNAQKISKTTSRLVEQLRRFLDEETVLEHKKILELSKFIQQNVIKQKHNLPKSKHFLSIDGVKADIDSVFEKKLYSIKRVIEFKRELREDIEEIDLSNFYNLFYIDEEKLKDNITYFLQSKEQVRLKDIIEHFPIKKGVSELISYLTIAQKSSVHIIDSEIEYLEIEDESSNKKIVKMPKVIFVRD